MYFMINYYENYFKADIQNLTFYKPNKTIMQNPNVFRIDKETLFWGGRNWENIKKDLERISPENIENYILTLFCITSIDLGMFSQFGGIHSNAYQILRKETNIPKFGWCGLGPHFENPKKILSVPLELNLLDFTFTKNNPDEVALYFKYLCDKFLLQLSEETTSSIFINHLLADKDFKITESDKEVIFAMIYTSLKKLVS